MYTLEYMGQFNKQLKKLEPGIQKLILNWIKKISIIV